MRRRACLASLPGVRCGGDRVRCPRTRTKGTVGTEELRVGAIMLATLLGMYAFFRSFLR